MDVEIDIDMAHASARPDRVTLFDPMDLHDQLVNLARMDAGVVGENFRAFHQDLSSDFADDGCDDDADQGIDEGITGPASCQAGDDRYRGENVASGMKRIGDQHLALEEHPFSAFPPAEHRFTITVVNMMTK